MFTPSSHLIKLKGKDYLEVRWRIMWLRDEHPDAHIETTLVQLDAEHAVVKAEVEIPDAGSATGYAMCKQAEFPDYLEKAETSAIGRALGALGFGTQFCDDHDGQGKLADSPVQYPSGSTGSTQSNVTPASGGNNYGTLTEKQRAYIFRVAKDNGWSNADIHGYIREVYNVESVNDLTKTEGSATIDYIQANPIRTNMAAFAPE